MFGIPYPANIVIALIFVIGLIFAAAWAVRKFGAGALGGSSMRGRHPRLAVLEHTLLEGRRRLYLVRRDNVEHLLLVGGATDIVVEANIVRAVPAARDMPMTRPPAAAESGPRAIPLPDSSNGAWPLQPEPAAGPRVPRNEPPSEDHAGWPPLQPHNEAPPRVQRDTLAALADELSNRPVPQPRSRPAANPKAQLAEQRSEPRIPNPQSAEPPPPTDQSLAEMAHRLESALRKPSPKPESREMRAPSTMPRPAVADEQTASEDTIPTPQPNRSTRPPENKAPRPDSKQPTPGKALYDSLEQEMASLLGRPTSNKP